jgi:hypothetical protein
MFEEECFMFRVTQLIPLAALAVLLVAVKAAAAQVFVDDFENYNLGSLDKDDPNGPNQDANGDSANPWFGGFPPNFLVVGPENGVTPISGSQMIRPVAPGDRDQLWLNIAYQFNGGQPFTGNVVLDWWFYDPLGAGGTDYTDYVALAFYNTAPTDTDGPIFDPPDDIYDYDLNHTVNGGMLQRLSLGATTAVGDAGFDPNYYQARVVGATDGYNANGWFNTSVPRSVGWHHAVIVVGRAQDDGTNDVSFFIDDLDNPTLEHNSVLNFGYNVIELNGGFSGTTGYYDLLTFDTLGG